MRTLAGTDKVSAQLLGTPGTAANYMAITANSSAAVNTDTTLTGEITTAGGGLLRATATYAHTTGTATTTMTKTFTANGSDTVPVTVAKIGVFDAATAGNLVFETLLASTATLSAPGDNVLITESITWS